MNLSRYIPPPLYFYSEGRACVMVYKLLGISLYQIVAILLLHFYVTSDRELASSCNCTGYAYCSNKWHNSTPLLSSDTKLVNGTIQPPSLIE
jgi:hypothetical protein